jgi:photosystem II stability/assembly factor-like uncharacterized protein
MKRKFGIILVAVVAALLQGCLGSGGSSAPPPTNVTATPKDSRVVVTWNPVPGVQYWIFYANGTGVTPQNCSSMPLCRTAINVTSPASIPSLYNGYTYSFSINARTGGGPGGAGSTAVQTVPRIGGSTWTAGTAQGANALRGVAYGNTKFVAAGDGGALFSGTTDGANGITWTSLASANPMPTTKFNAVSYNASTIKHFVAGAGGTILQSANAAVTWTKVADSKTTNELFALANNGTGFVVAVGASGTIVTTADSGTTWADHSLASTPNLNGVAYGYDSTNLAYRFVAVGDTGTLLWSTDGVTWNNVTSAAVTTANLKAVTNGYDSNSVYHFVAVGANGTVLTSPDGVTWTKVAFSATTAPAMLTANLNSIVSSTGRRFVAVSNTGQVFYSEIADLTTWTQAAVSPTTASPIYAVTTGGLFDYIAVGASGLNLYAD